MAEQLLVVDDEPNMLRLLKTILMDKTGYEVTTTNNLSILTCHTSSIAYTTPSQA